MSEEVEVVSTVQDEATIEAARETAEEGSLASVIFVERDEEIATICGRVDSAPTFAVVVNVPRGNRHMEREIGIRRLRRHAEDAGKTLAIATRSASLTSRARQASIPVSRRPDRIRWDSGGRAALWLGGHSIVVPAIGRYLGLFALILAIVGLAGTVVFAGPTATIIVYPETETVRTTIVLTASEFIDTVDLVTMTVPATRVTAERVITLAVPTTGTIQVPIDRAGVDLVITNPGDVEVIVPAGTIVSTSGGVRFKTDVTVTAPAGGSVPVAATADVAGVEGNVLAETITAWGSLTFAALTVMNPGEALGGRSREEQAVGSADVLTLKSMVEELSISQQLKEQVIEARPHDAIFLRTVQVAAVDGPMSDAIGTPAKVLFMDVRITLSALAVVSETLDIVIAAALADKTEGEFVLGTVTAVETGARQADFEDGSLTTELLLTAQVAVGLTPEQIEAVVKGRTTGGAASALAQQLGVGDAEVRLSPSWAPWLPRFTGRLDVEFRSREVEAESGIGALGAGEADDGDGQSATDGA